MFEPDVVDNRLSRLPAGTIAATVVVVLAVVIVAAVVVPALVWMLGYAVPIVLLWLGAELVAERKPVLGAIAVTIGGLWLVSRLPLVALLAGAGAIGWMLARRSG